jgi:hypothetical protein
MLLAVRIALLPCREPGKSRIYPSQVRESSGESRFILKEVAMPIDSILVSVAVVAMFAILGGALLWADFQTRSPRKDIK